tara:strand:- start:194 stop:523 length:330 start_codon:yes stop_codon:yes gene_type:complete
MGRLSKLKAENIKKANELLDKGHTEQYTTKNVKLKPSENVTTNSQSFVNKMNGLKEEKETVEYKHINEEPEKDTYWMITKANRDNLLKLGGTPEEIGKSATNNFQKYCK